MKKLYLFLMFLCAAIHMHAQGEFLLTRESDESYGHGDSKTSALIVQCNNFSMPLSVSSPVFGVYTPKYVLPDENNKNNVMYIYEINVPDSKWEQQVTFMIDGYKSQKAMVTFTKGKQAVVFTINDPNKATTGYYYHRRIYREYLEKGDYERAMAELKTAETTTNANKEELQLLMEEITKIQDLYATAQDSADVKNYFAAGRIYGQILELNKNDKRADTLMADMDTKFKDYTAMLYSEAEGYFAQRKYSEAAEYFQNYLNFHGTNREMATSRLNDVKRGVQNKRVMPHVLYYQFDKKAPINFGYGRFTNRKVGWFMNLSMNAELFNLIDGGWDPKDKNGKAIEVYERVVNDKNQVSNGISLSDVRKKIDNVPEISLAIVGLSIPLISPQPEKENNYFKLGKLTIPKFPALYLNIVPISASLSFGYDGTEYFKQKEDQETKIKIDEEEYYTKDLHQDEYNYTHKHKTTTLFSYAPQAGLTLKWGRLALFYTFEYRYLVNERDKFKDHIRSNRNMFGIGIAW